MFTILQCVEAGSLSRDIDLQWEYLYSLLCYIHMALRGMQAESWKTEPAVSYRQISIISHTKSLNLNDSPLVLPLSLLSLLKPGVKSRMMM